jgi:5-carboxymethyl-2-hydroxymuconate isomerase
MDTTLDVTPKLYSDSIEFMSVYIARMRVDEDFNTIPRMLNHFNDMIFDNKEISKDQLRQLAVYTTDYTYRFAADAEVQDAYTIMYFKIVIARLMKSLQEHGIELFYILDNEIQGNRFELVVDLYKLMGAAVVAPYNGNEILSYETVEAQLKDHMARGKNVVYIEKDASVNYMEKVMKMATESRYIGIFRNQAPTTKHVMVL